MTANRTTVFLPRVGLHCNVDLLDRKWHGWLSDDQGFYIRRATQKQYAEAIRRHCAACKRKESQ